MSDQPTNPAGDNERIIKLLENLAADVKLIKERLDVVEARLMPTNQLPAVVAAVDTMSRKVDVLEQKIDSLGQKMDKLALDFRVVDKMVSRHQDRIGELEERFDNLEQKKN